MGIMDTPCPASRATDEVALVFDNGLQDDREIAFVVNERPGTLGQAEDGDMGALLGPHVVAQNGTAGSWFRGTKLCPIRN